MRSRSTRSSTTLRSSSASTSRARSSTPRTARSIAVFLVVGPNARPGTSRTVRVQPLWRALPDSTAPIYLRSTLEGTTEVPQTLTGCSNLHWSSHRGRPIDGSASDPQKSPVAGIFRETRHPLTKSLLLAYIPHAGRVGREGGERIASQRNVVSRRGTENGGGQQRELRVSASPREGVELSSVSGWRRSSARGCLVRWWTLRASGGRSG